jgi:septum formation protein
MKTPALILASTSPYRKALLSAFGLKFMSHAPDGDESVWKRQGPIELEELTRFLALRKAHSLSGKFPDAVILGSDQIAEFEGRRLDKPGTRERAREQLLAMRGKSHRLITSLAVCFGPENYAHTDVTTIHMREFDEATLQAYLDLDQPFDCAGSYKIERAGLCLIDSVETQDPSAIQGLPLTGLIKAFEKLNLHLVDFWSVK